MRRATERISWRALAVLAGSLGLLLAGDPTFVAMGSMAVAAPAGTPAAAAAAAADPAPTRPAPGGSPPAAEAPGRGDPGFLGQLSLGSSREPIVIVADRLDFDYQKNRITYLGKVKAAQGDLTIDSDTLIITLDRADDQRQAELREVIAQGNVVITQGARRATGGTAVYSQPQRKIVLTGDPVLRDGQNEVSGDRLIVFLDEGRSVVESSPKKRVSAILHPGSGEGGSAAASPPAAKAPKAPKAPNAAEVPEVPKGAQDSEAAGDTGR